MEVNKIKISTHTSFGAKICDSAIPSFANIGYACAKNNEYDEFKSEMKKIRETLPVGIIKRKGGTGLCISIPAVFKESMSKTDSRDTNISQYFKNPSLETLKTVTKELKKLEELYTSATTMYKDITGKDFVVPKMFCHK